MEIRYPEIFVPLVGYDGNAFGILARCHRAMRRAGLGESEWEEFRREATSGRYEHLLVTVCTWFDTGLDLIDDDPDSGETCDLCDEPTWNGAGHYLDELGTEERLCRDCAEDRMRDQRDADPFGLETENTERNQ